MIVAFIKHTRLNVYSFHIGLPKTMLNLFTFYSAYNNIPVNIYNNCDMKMLDSQQQL